MSIRQALLDVDRKSPAPYGGKWTTSTGLSHSVQRADGKETFQSLLVSIAGSEVLWVNELVPMHHDLKAYKFLYLTRRIHTGMGAVTRV